MKAKITFFKGEKMDGMVNQAMEYSGPGGRLATIPDIVTARICAPDDDEAWQPVTAGGSWLLCGYHNGEPVVVVAHGLKKSISEPSFVALAYHEGHFFPGAMEELISVQLFHDVASDRHGKVQVIPWGSIEAFERVQGLEPLSPSRALAHPLVPAILGPNAAEYLGLLAKRDIPIIQPSVSFQPPPAPTMVNEPRLPTEDRNWAEVPFAIDPMELLVSRRAATPATPASVQNTPERCSCCFSLKGPRLVHPNGRHTKADDPKRDDRPGSLHQFFWKEEKRATVVARLLSISGRIADTHPHAGGTAHEGLLTEVSCLEPGDKTTLAAVRVVVSKGAHLNGHAQPANPPVQASTTSN